MRRRLQWLLLRRLTVDQADSPRGSLNVQYPTRNVQGRSQMLSQDLTSTLDIPCWILDILRHATKTSRRSTKRNEGTLKEQKATTRLKLLLQQPLLPPEPLRLVSLPQELPQSRHLRRRVRSSLVQVLARQSQDRAR